MYSLTMPLLSPQATPAIALHRMALLIIYIGVLCLALPMQAQPGRTTLLAPDIRTLRTAVDGDTEKLPIITLGTSEQIEFSFDDMTHEYRRYTYRITHCNPDGAPTDDLFESDYVQSAAEEEVIDDYETSINTTVLYTHYRLALPNTHMRPLLAGDYRLTISRENEDGDVEPVVETYFGVTDNSVGVRPTCTTNTDIDWNDAHQQLSLRVDLGSLPLRDAATEVQTVVMQNRRFDNLVRNTPPTSQDANVLIWDHCRDFIFPAGNEYRKFEMLSTRYPGLHGESMRWYDPLYHNTLFPDAPRRNYLYDEDRNGRSIIRYESTSSPETEADYVVTHFRLVTLPVAGYDFYVSGNWASLPFSPDYRMTYNPQSEAYEADILLKTGYYNYLYLALPHGQTDGAALTAPAEGDFFQTENEYTILVYYKQTGTRYWKLAAAVSPIFRKS